ncbi:hypothetical protein N7517_008094 [Penicillium concentricum]|uniref:Subtelomeric hrmA-associated cluster protein AFUB-079030/YDR124W-like helical bundle domain-containing protein n=1 Tax=Penicillium concentricum TaxID=293559 RepID=A0A9W9RRQ5_9EURO|nr:uncharacterized protein N7517_008094 [Penicillium concentricum]KAJ5365208.1 hypothetical protein N7517_008094 [Penicillium concentricum]
MKADTNDSMACHIPIAIDGESGRSHFALIFIDTEGDLHLQCSRSIATSFLGSLSVRLADNFLKAVAMSEEASSPIYQTSPHQTTPAMRKCSPSPRMAHITPRKTELDGKAHTQDFPPANPFLPTVGFAHTESSPRWDMRSPERIKRNVWSVDNKMWRPDVTISVMDRDLLRRYYEKAFHNLQQTNCRTLAKAYVKLVEPRKQVYFPYNGRTVVTGFTQELDPEATKPPWWPAGVRHREPDHLLKEDGQRLVRICRLNLPETVEATSNHNDHNGESIPFDAAPTDISNTTFAYVKSGSVNNSPPALFAPVANFPAHFPLDHPYDVQGHCLGNYYAGPDPKTVRGFDMTVPVSMPPHGLKRKHESEEIAHVDATKPAVFTHDFSLSVTGDLQPYPVQYPGGPCNFLPQGFISPGPSTTEALAQPKECRDISYHLGY